MVRLKIVMPLFSSDTWLAFSFSFINRAYMIDGVWNSSSAWLTPIRGAIRTRRIDESV